MTEHGLLSNTSFPLIYSSSRESPLSKVLASLRMRSFIAFILEFLFRGCQTTSDALTISSAPRYSGSSIIYGMNSAA